MKNKQVIFEDWGLIDYKQAWDKAGSSYLTAPVKLKTDIRNRQTVLAAANR